MFAYTQLSADFLWVLRSFWWCQSFSFLWLQACSLFRTLWAQASTRNSLYLRKCSVQTSGSKYPWDHWRLRHLSSWYCSNLKEWTLEWTVSVMIKLSVIKFFKNSRKSRSRKAVNPLKVPPGISSILFPPSQIFSRLSRSLKFSNLICLMLQFLPSMIVKYGETLNSSTGRKEMFLFWWNINASVE